MSGELISNDQGIVTPASAWFDSATFNFLALLVKKSNRKTDIWKICKILKNLKENFPDFALKKVQKHFLTLEFRQVAHQQDLKSCNDQ